MTAPLDLDGLEKLCKEATPGPWWSDWDGTAIKHVFASDHTIIRSGFPKNSDFVAAANPATVLALIARVRELELNDNYSGVHTCHANCKKWYCLLRKERDALREKLEVAEEALESTHTSGHLVVAMWGCPACDYFAKIRGMG